MDLIKISKSIISNIDSIDNLVDTYFEPIKDITDTASDMFTPIKAIQSLYTLNKRRKYKAFLKFYAKSLDENGFINFANTESLAKYLKKDKNFNFLHETLENAVNSKSIYASMILGYYAGIFLSETKNVNLKDLITIEGLMELNDIELSCFIRIYNLADLSKLVKLRELKLGAFEFFSLLTVEKLVQLRFLEKDPNIYFGSNNHGNFISTEIAEDVFFLIKKMGIENELINYEM